MIDNLDYDQLDPGIRETVRLIRSWGYETSDSGDGRSKEGVRTDPDILECPHVAVQDPEDQGPESADGLWARIEDHFGGEDQVPTGVMVEVTYEARQCSELLMVTGLDDAMLATVSINKEITS